MKQEDVTGLAPKTISPSPFSLSSATAELLSCDKSSLTRILPCVENIDFVQRAAKNTAPAKEGRKLYHLSSDLLVFPHEGAKDFPFM